MTRIRHLDKYYLLLAVQLVFIITLPFFEAAEVNTGLVLAAGLSLILFAGFNTLNKGHGLRRSGLSVVVIFILLNIFRQFSDISFLFAVTFLLFFILFVLVDVSIIRMLIFSKEIRPSFIAGSVAGYLMIGISLAFFLAVVGGFDKQALSIVHDDLGFSGYLYFSLITMTTIGYGEISPVNPVVRTAAALTGVFSQFYMAVIVAVIVGKLMRKNARLESDK